MGAQSGMACDRETVTRQIELLLNQLEAAKYKKMPNWAARICGGIEMLLWCRDGQGGSGGSAGEVTRRMERAVVTIMADEPKAPGMTDGMLPGLEDGPQQLQTVDAPVTVNAVPFGQVPFGQVALGQVPLSDTRPGATPPENPHRL